MALTLEALTAYLDGLGVPAVSGQAATKASLPYVVGRPLILDFDELALNGDAISWDNQYSLYCAGASVDASFNLAKAVMQALHGQYVLGSTLATSLGYIGAQVEGHYETQVTVQINQGGI